MHVTCKRAKKLFKCLCRNEEEETEVKRNLQSTSHENQGHMHLSLTNKGDTKSL